MAQILLITFSGILIVFMTLVLLVLVFTGFGKLMSKGDKKASGNASKPSHPVQAVVQPKKVAAAAPAVEEGIPGAVIAAIAAAVSMMGEQDGKVYSVRSVRRERAGRPVWALAGIMENTKPF